MRLAPDPHVSAEDIERGQAALVRDAAFASLAGSLYGGVVLVGFALALGASPFIIGLLAALPLLSQAAQLPAISLVERLRRRRQIAVISVSVARAAILALALIPLLVPEHWRLPLLIGTELVISVLGSICACAMNSWMHQLLPRPGLGSFFARRLFWGTTLGCAGALAAGFIVDYWPYPEKLHAYALVFAAGALSGFISSRYIAQVPEPEMTQAGPPATVWEKIRIPFRDRNFRSILVFVAAWNVASNIAAPFIAVYLMRQLGYPLSTVMLLNVASQLANTFTLYAWGSVSDRLSNKAVLALAVPVYFASVFGLAIAATPERHGLTLPLLAVFHVVMGWAAGGIGLATGNIGIKLAPAAEATAYLAAVSITVSLAGGIAPIIGGGIAEWLEASRLSLVVHWMSATRTGEIFVLNFAHWEFLFAISAVAGLYVMHRLAAIREGTEIVTREVMQALAVEAARSINPRSSVGGVISGLVSFGRLIERRLVRRN